MNRNSNHSRSPSGLWGSPEFLFAVTRGAYREGPGPGDGAASKQPPRPAPTPVESIPRRGRLVLYLAAARRRLTALWSGDRPVATKAVPAE